MVFAAVSFYWAAGGTIGVDTLALDLERKARVGDATGLALAAGLLKLGVAGLAIALARRCPRAAARRALVIAGWVVGAGFALYGVALTLEKALMEAGVIDVPAGLGSDRVAWYLFLWDPLWLLGGLLLILATVSFARRCR